MLVTIKTLKQETFQIEIENQETVRDLKDRIETVKGNEFVANNLKLIYAGQILNDNKTLESYKIEEKKYIVVMIMKAESPEEAAKVSENRPVKPNEGSTTSELDESALTADSMLTGTEYNTAVNKLVQMGYDRELVVKAMRASFNNPVMAVEYLVNGIPDSADSSTEDESFSMLREQPEFRQIRRAVRENPELLNAILQQIGEANPSVLQYISENQEAFINMVNETSDEGDQSVMDVTAPDDVVELTSAALNISTQDEEAIERLKALGFSEEHVIQVYFACDKDENLTANCLLENDENQ